MYYILYIDIVLATESDKVLHYICRYSSTFREEWKTMKSLAYDRNIAIEEIYKGSCQT